MTKKSRRAKTRRALLTLSLVLVVALASVGGTIAWLTSVTGVIENTFTVGNITITLDETKYDENGAATNARTTTGNAYDLIPGNTYKKDPTVTVAANSEACWLFVQYVPTGKIDALTFTNALTEAKKEDGTALWTKLSSEGVAGDVYYTEVAPSTSAQPFELITPDSDGNYLKVKDTFTGLSAGETSPELVYKAFAVQTANRTFTEAWDVVKAQAYTAE